jgi:hypothetical protein
MKYELNETEVRLIQKLLKRELTHVKTEIKLVKIFDLQNKLKKLDDIGDVNQQSELFLAFDLKPPKSSRLIQ